MISDKPFIFYSLPKSRTTQQLIGGRKIEKAWENVSNFLINCSTTNSENPSSISLTTHSAFPGDHNPEIAEKITSETQSLFGIGKQRPVSYSYPSGTPSEEIETEWDLKSNQLEKVLTYMIDGQPWPKFTLEPIELVLSYNFKLVNPLTKNQLPNQEHESRLMIWLSRSCCCSPDLFFPFETSNREFYNYLDAIEQFVPFKLEQKYLRLGKPNKKRNNYTFSKLKA